MPYKNKEAAVARSRRYYELNKEKIKSYQKEYKKKFNSQDNRENYLWYEYGLTLEDYDALLLKQEFKCGICEKHISDLSRPLFVDHDHDTGAVRGLLCIKCNTALGIFGDNIHGLLKAVTYLEKANTNG